MKRDHPLKLMPLEQLKKVLAGMVPPVVPKSKDEEPKRKSKPERTRKKQH